jgi:type IV pilus assembly protein PilM
MANLDLNNMFQSLFAKKPKGYVGLDIGSSFIKVVQLQKKGSKAMLDTYGEIAVGPLAGLEVGQSAVLPVDKIVEAVNDLFTEAKVTSRDLVFSLPLSTTLVTVIEMPDVGEEKLKEMIPLEARKYIPTPVAEVSLSHWVIPSVARTYIDPDKEEALKTEKPKVEVLLVAVHNDILARYTDIATKLGATSASFEIEIFSSIRSALGRSTDPTMIIDIGAATTNVVVVEEGIIRSSHAVNVGSQDVTLALSRARGITMLEAEEIKRDFGLLGDPSDPSIAEITRLSVERLFTEANRIYTTYRHTKRTNIAKVILVGGGAMMKGIVDVAKSTFDATVIPGAAFEKVEAPAVVAPLLADAGPEFAVAVGLALRNLESR